MSFFEFIWKLILSLIITAAAAGIGCWGNFLLSATWFPFQGNIEALGGFWLSEIIAGFLLAISYLFHSKSPRQKYLNHTAVIVLIVGFSSTVYDKVWTFILLIVIYISFHILNNMRLKRILKDGHSPSISKVGKGNDENNDSK